MEYKECFILMPFSKTDDLNKSDLDYIYTHILKKAVDEYEVNGKKYFHTVERFNSNVGSIISGIVNKLNTADLVIADLTGLNHNVMYELGVRHSLKRGTIIISQDLSNLPSDLRDYLTVGYKYSKTTTEQPSHYDTFKIELHKTISEVLSTNKYDSPVLSYLQQKQRFRDEGAIEKLQQNAIIINVVHSEAMDISQMIESLEKTDYFNSQNYLQIFNLRFTNLLSALQELNIPPTSTILYENIVYTKTILSEMLKMFSLGEYFSAMNIEDAPQNLFGNYDIRNCIEKEFINLFEVEESTELKYTNMKQMFSENGILDVELFKELHKYIRDKSKELGVENDEINKILES